MIESTTVIGVGTGMRVVCRRDELVSRLAIVARAVSARANVQILAGILIRAEAGRLQLAATDMELSLRASLDAQGEDEGAGAVPRRLLVDPARLLPAGAAPPPHPPPGRAPPD